MAHWMCDTVDCQVIYVWMDGSGVYGLVYTIHRLIRFKAALTVALASGILLIRRATEYLHYVWDIRAKGCFLLM